MPARLKHWTDDEAAELLSRVPLFRGLPETALWSIAALARPQTLDKGEMLFREGDAGDRFYIVYSGSLELLKERTTGVHERLAVKRAGDAFGEMSLLNEAPRSASARALEPTQLLGVGRQDFAALLGDSPLAIGLLRSLSRSLRSLDIRFTAKLGGDAMLDRLTQFSRVVQHGLMPHTLPAVPGYDLAVGVARDDETAGMSLWDVLPFGQQDALFAVFDVKGAGLPPGHLLALTRALLRQIADGPRTDLGRIMRQLNEAVADNLFAGLDECVDMALVHLTPNGAAPVACIAGDQPAFVVREDGSLEDVPSNGPALGILPHFEFEAQQLAMDPDDLLLVLTDMDGGLRRGVTALAADRRFETAPTLAGQIEKALVKARGLRDPEQDVAALVVKKLEDEPKREAVAWP